MSVLGVQRATRHPQDPEPVPSTKVNAIFALGIVGAVTGFFLGGAIPATIALVMAGPAREELRSAKGYLTGAPRLRWGIRLAWVGIVLALTALVIAAIIGLLHLAAAHSGTHVAPGTD